MSTTETAQATQVHRVYIKAAPERIWQAITNPGWNGRYGYGAPGHFELRPGGAYASHASDAMKEASAAMGWELPEVIVDGEVVEVDPPRRLVQTWRMVMDPTAAAEGFSRLTYEIEGPGEDGVCRLTVTHELGGMPTLAAMTSGDNEFGAMGGGGWPWILSDLKTLLETGEAFTTG
ncbi:Uncharacterized conserved protein YndB, AHSA1/START domain [Modestobacter sp. DSM 44400]|uniref:SRPBCC family protein n=1 Tax=Modestobacter sp. DSM 44400 TaxID=1550230 RepID=UPI00089B56C3|nr:SRPBCC family protein [Modestobacter sp. DSM 44400]SDY35053.1 Uncharacterized conserved protein YndB, AHSA1/START domain [Modestobacter sp. DSM 44400]